MKRFIIAALTSTLAACGAPPKEESIDAESCEHLKEGPGVAVTASAAASGSPSVSEQHKRFDIALVDITGGKGGAVSYASSAEGDLIVFLSADVPLKVKNSAGADVAIEATATSVAECTEIKARHTIPVGVGTYTLNFGPTAATSVQLVAETEAHAH